jgi:hypothetical protein
MDRREREVSPERVVDAVERNDAAELARLREELSARDERQLLDLESHAEHAAQARSDNVSTLDRIRNVFQAILLDRWLRGKRH